MTDSSPSSPYLPTYKEQGSGPLLLFLHGLGGNRHSFDHQLAVLSPRYRCVAWDVPGYGGSPPVEQMDFTVLARCVDNLLSHLQAQPLAVIGHSLGGMVAQAWYAQGGRCEKLILAQTTARFGKPGSEWNQEFLAARLAPLEQGLAPADFARDLIAGMFHDASKGVAIDEAIATMAPLPADVYRQVIECLVTFDCFDKLPNITVPTLCLAAEFDKTAPAKALAQMAQQIPGAQYECLPAAGHLAYVECAQLFTAALADFLEPSAASGSD